MLHRDDQENIILAERPVHPGAPPGILHTPPGASPCSVDVTVYDDSSFIRKRLSDISELNDLETKGKVLWVDVNGLGSPEIINAIGKNFGFHKLSLEDVVHIPQRPKADFYPDHLFVVTQMPLPKQDPLEEFEQISVFAGRGYVVTFQASETNWLKPIVNRLEESVGRLRNLGADYLAYAVLDLIMDAYFPALEDLDGTLDSLEEQISAKPGTDTVGQIYILKRSLLALRRAAWGMREAIGNLTRSEEGLIEKATVYYLRDTYDHSIRVVELAEQYRDLAGGLMDWYQSCLSQRMNEIMKTLTIIATIFIPLTFIAGIYGMNFDPSLSKWNMPELRLPYGYPAVWGIMVLCTLAMCLFFRRKGWLGRPTQ